MRKLLIFFSLIALLAVNPWTDSALLARNIANRLKLQKLKKTYGSKVYNARYARRAKDAELISQVLRKVKGQYLQPLGRADHLSLARGMYGRDLSRLQRTAIRSVLKDDIVEVLVFRADMGGNGFYNGGDLNLWFGMPDGNDSKNVLELFLHEAGHVLESDKMTSLLQRQIFANVDPYGTRLVDRLGTSWQELRADFVAFSHMGRGAAMARAIPSRMEAYPNALPVDLLSAGGFVGNGPVTKSPYEIYKIIESRLIEELDRLGF